MKKLFALFGIISISLAAVYATNDDEVIVTSDPVTEERPMADFKKIEAGGAFDLKLEQGDKNLVKITADANLMKNIITEVDNEILKIKLNKNTKGDFKEIEIHIIYKEINEIDLSGASEINGLNEIKTEKLTINLSGASEIKLNVNVNDLNTTIAGASEAYFKGIAQNHILSISGAADLDAFELETQKTDIKISGAANAKINVKQDLKANISGIAKLQYKEEPANKEIKSSGMGEINKKDSTRISVGKKRITISDGDDDVDIDIDDITNGCNKNKKIKFKGHWAGIDLGINGYLDHNNQFEVPAKYSYLELRQEKSWGININLVQQSFRIAGNKNYTDAGDNRCKRGGQFGVVTGLGWGYNNYRFVKNTKLTSDSSTIFAIHDTLLPGNFTKTKLTVSYAQLPVLFEYQFPTQNKHKRYFYVMGGAIFGMKLGSHAKQVYYENGDKVKPKQYENYHLNPVKCDLTFRVGWRFLDLFANYSVTTLFKDNKGPELHPFMIGLQLAHF